MASLEHNGYEPSSKKRKKHVFDPFNLLLVEIGDAITPDKFHSMRKYLRALLPEENGHHIPEAAIHEMKDAHDLISELQSRAIIHKYNTGALQALLKKVGLEQLEGKLMDYNGWHGRPADYSADYYADADYVVNMLKETYTERMRRFLPPEEDGVVLKEESRRSLTIENGKLVTMSSDTERPADKFSFVGSHIAYQWAQGDLTGYSLVFHIAMKRMTRGDLIDAVKYQLFHTNIDITRDYLLEVIKAQKKSVLFILDGYNESRSNLRNVMPNEISRYCECVATQTHSNVVAS